MRGLIFIFVFLVLASNVSAYTFINIYLDESGSALFFGGTDEVLSLPEGIKVSDEEIIGKTPELTTKKGEIWRFSYYLKNADISLILPKGAAIRSIDEGEIYIKENRISISNSGGINLTYVIEEQPGDLFLWFVLSFIILGVLVIAFFYVRQKRLKHDNRIKRKDDLMKKILNERENLILDKLRGTGKIKASQLRKICDIPKASFSRHVRELERKELLRRIGEGKNKFLVLN